MVKKVEGIVQILLQKLFLARLLLYQAYYGHAQPPSCWGEHASTRPPMQLLGQLKLMWYKWNIWCSMNLSTVMVSKLLKTMLVNRRFIQPMIISRDFLKQYSISEDIDSFLFSYLKIILNLYVSYFKWSVTAILISITCKQYSFWIQTVRMKIMFIGWWFVVNFRLLDCPLGWVIPENMTSTSCYLFSTDSKNWESAQVIYEI